MFSPFVADHQTFRCDDLPQEPLESFTKIEEKDHSNPKETTACLLRLANTNIHSDEHQY